MFEILKLPFSLWNDTITIWNCILTRIDEFNSKKREHCVYLVCTLLYILSTSSIPASEKINTKADPCWWSSMTVTYVAKTRVMEIQLTAGLKSTFLTVYLVGLAAERK